MSEDRRSYKKLSREDELKALLEGKQSEAQLKLRALQNAAMKERGRVKTAAGVEITQIEQVYKARAAKLLVERNRNLVQVDKTRDAAVRAAHSVHTVAWNQMHNAYEAQRDELNAWQKEQNAPHEAEMKRRHAEISAKLDVDTKALVAEVELDIAPMVAELKALKEAAEAKSVKLVIPDTKPVEPPLQAAASAGAPPPAELADKAKKHLRKKDRKAHAPENVD